LWAVSGLAKFHRRSPDQISDAEVQAYLLHQIRERHSAWSTCNIVVQGLRFLYHTTLKRERTTFTIPSPRQSGKLPVLLSREEIQRLLAATHTRKQYAILATTYGAGLRLGEVIHLRVSDIDGERLTIRVEQGKGGRDRYTLLSTRVLETLRAYWPPGASDGLALPWQGGGAAAGSVNGPENVRRSQGPGGHHQARRHP